MEERGFARDTDTDIPLTDYFTSGCDSKHCTVQAKIKSMARAGGAGLARLCMNNYSSSVPSNFQAIWHVWQSFEEAKAPASVFLMLSIPSSALESKTIHQGTCRISRRYKRIVVSLRLFA